MYLTRLNLDPRNQAVQNWLQNPYRIHQRMWKGIPEEIQRKHESLTSATPPFLYKVENKPQLRMLVQSSYFIDWNRVFQEDKLRVLRPAPEDTKMLAPEKFIITGRTFRFSLLANPTQKKIFSDSPNAVKSKAHQQGWKKAKKIGVYAEAEQLVWLTKRGMTGGFRIKSAIVESSEIISATKKKTEEGGSGEIKKIFTVAFVGLLEVTDAEVFTKTYTAGIGSAKAFGCGLLLLAPAHL